MKKKATRRKVGRRSQTAATGAGAPAIVAAPEKRVRFGELSPEQQRAFATPSGFGRYFLKIPLTPKQAAACDAFLPNRANVSCVFCNEAGKTTKVMVTVVLWHLMCFPRRGENGGVTATSGSWSQILNQFMPALHAHASKFPASWSFMGHEIKINGVPNFMAYACTQAGRAEGFHGSPDTPLMMLFDECKSVADGIIRAGEDRCRPQRLGLLSSPGFSMGKFYNSHTTEAPYWDRHKVTVDDCPWIDREAMRRVIERAGGGDYERGLQDPFIRSAYFAEFMPFVQDSLITLSEIEECLADPPGQKGNERHVFCDFAAGGDENVIGARRGNKVWIQDAWRDRNTMSACARFIDNFVKLRNQIGLKPEEIEGDNDGLGNPMVCRIQELGWPIIPFHSNSRAIDPTKFRNRSSELWFEGTEAIKERRVVIEDDADLKGQLVDRVGKAESSGLRWIESKVDLFRRQARDQRPQRSPDRADAILGAMGKLPVLGSMQMETSHVERNPYASFGPYIGEPHEAEPSVPEEVLRGFDAGG